MEHVHPLLKECIENWQTMNDTMVKYADPNRDEFEDEVREERRSMERKGDRSI